MSREFRIFAGDMKKLLLSLPLLAVLTVVMSCRFTSSNQRLADVDMLLVSRPDSALAQLRGMADTMATASRADRMFYQLLLADAQNKCYVDFTTDSMMKQVAAYYDRHGNTLDRIRAHYLLGCTYRDLGEAPQALQCYQDAVELADTTNHDHLRLLLKVYGQMAELYHSQYLPQDELRAYDCMYYFSLLLSDTIEQIRIIQQLTKPYYLSRDTDKVIRNIESAHQLFMKYGCSEMAVDANPTLAYILIQRGQLATANQALTEYERLSGLFDSKGHISRGHEYYYYIKGKYYLWCHKLDSAEIYFRLLPSTIDEKVIQCKGLLSVYRRKAIPDSVAKYSILYETAIDSQTSKRQTEVIHQMAKLYNYQRYQQKAEIETSRAMAAQYRLYVLFTTGLVVFILLYFTYRRYMKRKNQENARLIMNYDLVMSELGRVQNKLEHQQKLYDESLQNNTKEMENMKLVHDDLMSENARTIERLTHEKEQLSHEVQAYVEQISSLRQETKESAFLDSNIVKKFKTKRKWYAGYSVPTDYDWRLLTRLFSQNMPTAFEVMGKEETLITSEQRVCILLFLDFSNKEMSLVLGSSVQRISNLKSDINRKLFNDDSALSLKRNLIRKVKETDKS